ncbi:Folylpolyglutamate synthase [Rubripirellula lacrimiformis]|uniref:Dihydrofolate synthase/folylpolyglutamate synthase n=2 Tax=Rubripirellula lacrimiformis TaxID=1930273 RepID=A0A517NKI7_9BACT|nr:Folylpolyglutamate synthase [Rubripirellula lacrimiformis]
MHDLGSSDASQYQAALGFLYDRIDYERMTAGASKYPFGLARMRQLLDRLGLAHFLYPASATADSPVVSGAAGRAASSPSAVGLPATTLIHIAGTKGKGSTAAMVAASLTASGLKTGLYTSPHLHRLEERFRVDGELCEPSTLVDLVDRVRPVAAAMVAESMVAESVPADQQVAGRESSPAAALETGGAAAGGSPSFFELTTAIALLHFHLCRCDAVVLETGLGGRLDSTNVCWPTVTAITSIGLDHQHVLGNTLGEIAAEKAGIIKPGVPVVSGVSGGAAADVIGRIAADQSAPLYQVDRDYRVDWQPAEGWGAKIKFTGHTSPLAGPVDVEMAMEGRHQAGNAAIAIAVTQILRKRCGIAVDDQAIVRGMGGLRCEGRIERYQLADQVIGIVDAAHNEDSIAALCDCLCRRAADGPLAIVFGTSLDKSAGPMLDRIASLADHVDLRMLQITRFHGNPRWRPTSDLIASLPPAIAALATVNEDPIAACEAARKAVAPGGTMVVCGSFFLAAETRGWMNSAHEGPR